MLNNLVILSEKLGIWDLRGQKIWDLRGQKFRDLRGQKFWDFGFDGVKNLGI